MGQVALGVWRRALERFTQTHRVELAAAVVAPAPAAQTLIDMSDSNFYF